MSTKEQVDAVVSGTGRTGRLRRWHRCCGGQSGQATVEYVGLAVAVAVLLVSMGGGLAGHGGKIGSAVAKKITQAVSQSAR